jgi:hypothetical protein
MRYLKEFLTESNAIEGEGPPTVPEVVAATMFTEAPSARLDLLAQYVQLTTRGAGRLRDQVGLDVRVGDHVAEPGGPELVRGFQFLLTREALSPLDLYRRFEHLHPFTDGNGRAGRLLWLKRRYDLGLPLVTSFLQELHYEVLGEFDRELAAGRVSW